MGGGRGGEGTEVGMGEKYGGAREEGGGGGEGKGRGYEGVECLRVSRVRGEEAKESTVDGGGEGGRVRGGGESTGERRRREEGEEKGRDVATRA